MRSVNPATATYSLNHGEQDRTYFRVCCRGPAGRRRQMFDLYHDAVMNQWVLDVAHDMTNSLCRGRHSDCDRFCPVRSDSQTSPLRSRWRVHRVAGFLLSLGDGSCPAALL